MTFLRPVLVRKQEDKVLIVSPSSQLRARILQSLGSDSWYASEVTGGSGALLQLRDGDFQTLLLDPNIRDLQLEELVATIRARYPKVNVVVLDQETKERQFSLSTRDREPLAETEPQHSTIRAETKVNRPDGPIAALWNRSSESTEDPMAAREVKADPLPGMIGTSPKMQQIYRLATLVAPRDTAVLIVGATGTGKELVARGIHALSRRSQRPFIVVNCAAIPESLLEAELFGVTRGAFTGAVQSRMGRIQAAQGGTLLLDEVGELPLSMQSKLLRFVQEGEVQRLGSVDVFRVDVRLIAATNADLLGRVREKQFREDLYYRLAVFPLDLPPLRERPEDVLQIAQHVLEILCRQGGSAQKAFSPQAVSLLRRYSWPGNVRELQHRIERAFVLTQARAQITGEDLAIHLRPDPSPNPNRASDANVPELNEVIPLAETERRAVLYAVRETRGDKAAAARVLQIGKSTLYRKLKRYGTD